MIIIIPLGGIGSRYKKNGYKKPKADVYIDDLVLNCFNPLKI